MPTLSRRPAPALPQRRGEEGFAHGPGEVRLIGGLWKRSKLPVPQRPGLRPTPDRVRETLFNWLGQDLSGWSVLDAFAGSGALGFEAASRGATRVDLVEQDAGLARALEAARVRLGAERVRVLRADALAWMAGQPAGTYDLVLLDPPYALDLFDAALAAADRLAGPQGWIYLEADRGFAPDALAARGWRVRREGRAGQVHYHLLERLPATVNDYTAQPTSAPDDPRSRA